MPITRRNLLISAAALPVAQGAFGALSASPAAAASAAGDVVGKITVGYQGWFACIGDGAPINAWWHWSQNESQAPSPSNENLKAWPDMTIYTQRLHRPRTRTSTTAARRTSSPPTTSRPWTCTAR